MPFLKVDIQSHGSFNHKLVAMIASVNSSKSDISLDDIAAWISCQRALDINDYPTIAAKYQAHFDAGILHISEDGGLTDTLRIYWE